MSENFVSIRRPWLTSGSPQMAECRYTIRKPCKSIPDLVFRVEMSYSGDASTVGKGHNNVEGVSRQERYEDS